MLFVLTTMVQPDRAVISDIYIETCLTVCPLFQYIRIVCIEIFQFSIILVITLSGSKVTSRRYSFKFVIRGVTVYCQPILCKEHIHCFLCSIITSTTTHTSVFETRELRTSPISIVPLVAQFYHNQFVEDNIIVLRVESSNSTTGLVGVELTIRIYFRQPVVLRSGKVKELFISFVGFVPLSRVFRLREKLFAI